MLFTSSSPCCWPSAGAGSRAVVDAAGQRRLAGTCSGRAQGAARRRAGRGRRRVDHRRRERGGARAERLGAGGERVGVGLEPLGVGGGAGERRVEARGLGEPRRRGGRARVGGDRQLGASGGARRRRAPGRARRASGEAGTAQRFACSFWANAGPSVVSAAAAGRKAAGRTGEKRMSEKSKDRRRWPSRASTWPTTWPRSSTSRARSGRRSSPAQMQDGGAEAPRSAEHLADLRRALPDDVGQPPAGRRQDHRVLGGAAALWQNSMLKWLGAKDAAEELNLPHMMKADKRFAHKEWSENAVFDYLKQSYLLTSGWHPGHRRHRRRDGPEGAPEGGVLHPLLRRGDEPGELLRAEPRGARGDGQREGREPRPRPEDDARRPRARQGQAPDPPDRHGRLRGRAQHRGLPGRGGLAERHHPADPVRAGDREGLRQAAADHPAVDQQVLHPRPQPEEEPGASGWSSRATPSSWSPGSTPTRGTGARPGRTTCSRAGSAAIDKALEETGQKSLHLASLLRRRHDGRHADGLDGQDRRQAGRRARPSSPPSSTSRTRASCRSSSTSTSSRWSARTWRRATCRPTGWRTPSTCCGRTT